MPSASFQSRPRRYPLARAFSLVELLVVIAVIALIVSIVIPAIGAARKSSKDADSRGLCVSLEQACSQFILDQRHVPGYFSARDMGAAANGTRGFSSMQNVMLDLAGGLATTGGVDNVGPFATTGNVRVDKNLIGLASASNKAYFTPKGKYYRVQDGVDPDAGNRNSAPENAQIPEVVDAEGTPILIWTIDETSTQPIPNVGSWQQVMAGQNSAQPSRFYWNSNSAFLDTDSASLGVGKRRIPQGLSSFKDGYSLIGPATTGQIRYKNLATFLSSPNSPQPFDPRIAAGEIADKVRPTASRGSFVIHAAGRDGVFFNRLDKGGRQSRGALFVQGPPPAPDGSTDDILYGNNFFPKSEDLVKGWDDIVISGN